MVFVFFLQRKGIYLLSQLMYIKKSRYKVISVVFIHK